MTIFYDSARFGLIPAGADACLYYDGRYAVTPEQAKRFGKVRWITIAGGAAAAAHTGAIDFETGNLAYEGTQLRDWAEERLRMNCRARVYFDLSDAKKAVEQVGGLRNVVYWVAIPGPRPTAAQVAAQMAAWGAPVPAEKVWGCQYVTAPSLAYDTSVLLSSW